MDPENEKKLIEELEKLNKTLGSGLSKLYDKLDSIVSCLFVMALVIVLLAMMRGCLPP